MKRSVVRRLSSARFVAWMVVAMGIAVRLWVFPPLHAIPEIDELGYATGGLLLLEGIPPAFKFAPAGLLTWIGMGYGSVVTLMNFLSPDPGFSAYSDMLKPLVALDFALFDIYADMSALRAVLLVSILIISSLGIYMAGRLGASYGGWSSVILCSGLVAFLPHAVELSLETRPYVIAWSLAVCALSLVANPVKHHSMIIAGILFGLAVASRIEMVLVWPIIAWQLWLSPHQRPLINQLGRVTFTALIAFLLAAPWYVTHLIGNLRKLFTVMALDIGGDSATGEFGESVFQLLVWDEGLGPALLLIIAGLFLCPREQRPKAVVAGIFLGLLIFWATVPLRHHGVLFVTVFVLAPYAWSCIKARLPHTMQTARFEMILPILILVFPIMRTIEIGAEIRNSWFAHDAVTWIEEHIPDGTKIYHQVGFVKELLPTTDSGDAFWGEVANSNVWQRTLQRRMEAYSIKTSDLPRALSMEHLYQVIGERRRVFILSAQGKQPGRSRYNIQYYHTSDRNTYRERNLDAARESYLASGGVFISRNGPIAQLKKPVIAWPTPDNGGVYIYTDLPSR